MKRSRKLFVLYMFVGWMVFLTLMSLLPAEGVAFGDKGDKIAHFGAYFITSLLCYYTFRSWFERADIYAVFFALGYGVILELAQLFVPGRIFSLNDLVANFSGVLFFFLLYRFLRGSYDL
jgi:VanZ family protein